VKTQGRNLAILLTIASAALMIASSLAFVAKAASTEDFRYGSAIYKGSVSDCATSATVGLTKAGFDGVNSEQHPSNSAVYGQSGSYTGVVLCTKAPGGTTYSELVFGPSGDKLETLFKALDTDFK
jgi:hypothetical protein